MSTSTTDRATEVELWRDHDSAAGRLPGSGCGWAAGWLPGSGCDSAAGWSSGFGFGLGGVVVAWRLFRAVHHHTTAGEERHVDVHD